MLLLVLSISTSNKETINQSIMSIIFYFKNEVLYMNAGGIEVSMEDYSNQVWNDAVIEESAKGISKSSLGKSAEIYGKKISEIKKYAVPFGEFGIKIIREITRIACAHLIFVMEETEKLSKKKLGKSSLMSIEKCPK